MSETFFDLTVAERKKRAALTRAETRAVQLFIAAAKNLPKSICIATDDAFEGEPHLIVSKRITAGSAMRVAQLRKKSLIF